MNAGSNRRPVASDKLPGAELGPRPPRPPMRVWAVTTGEVGMRSQARGLARGLDPNFLEGVVVPPSRPWRPARLEGLPTRGGGPPWPDVLITCGRRSIPFSFTARSEGVFTVHIQDPRTAPARFGLILAMEHDRIGRQSNVVKLATALHDVTPERLTAAGAAWRERLALLGPFAGVAIGGSVRGSILDARRSRAILQALRTLRASGLALAITPSRRTPPHLLTHLRRAFAGDDRVFLWDGAGDNPYLAILSLAQRLLVTSDSVSMISEALATPHPVDVLDLGIRRYRPFVDRLAALGLVRRFDGPGAPVIRPGPVDAMPDALRAVLLRYRMFTGRSR